MVEATFARPLLCPFGLFDSSSTLFTIKVNGMPNIDISYIFNWAKVVTNTVRDLSAWLYCVRMYYNFDDDLCLGH